MPNFASSSHARDYLSGLARTDPSTLTVGGDRAVDLVTRYVEAIADEPAESMPRTLYDHVVAQAGLTSLSVETVQAVNAVGRPTMTYGPQNPWTHFWGHGSLYLFQLLMDDHAYGMLNALISSKPKNFPPVMMGPALIGWRAQWMLFASVFPRIAAEPDFAEATVAESAALVGRVPAWKDVLVFQTGVMDQHLAAWKGEPAPPANGYTDVPDEEHPYPMTFGDDTNPNNHKGGTVFMSGLEVLGLIAIFAIPALIKKYHH